MRLSLMMGRKLSSNCFPEKTPSHQKCSQGLWFKFLRMEASTSQIFPEPLNPKP